MIKVYHIIDKTFNGGAYSQLKYLYNALKYFYSDRVDQKILLIDITKKHKIDRFFDLPHSVYDFKKLQSIYKNNSLFLYHKLMCSPVIKMVSSLKSIGIPVLVLNHTYSVNDKFMNVGNPDACISVSSHMSEKIYSCSFVKKIFTIKNWCDIRYVNSLPVVSFDLPKEELVFGRINGFNDIKYSKSFMKWFLRADFGKKAILQYVGSGHKLKDAKDLVCNLKHESINTIEFLGQVNNDAKKFSLIKSWDAFLYHINMPEGTSMSVVESLVCGTPVICNLPGNTELIKDNINGLVYKNFSEIESFVKDNGKIGLKSLKEKCTSDSNSYSAKQWVYNYINVFEECVSVSKYLSSNSGIPNKDRYSNVFISTVKKHVKKSNNKIDLNKNKKSKSIKVHSPIRTNKFHFPIKKSVENKNLFDRDKPKVITKLKNNIIKNTETKYENFADHGKFSILTASYNNEKYLDFYFNTIIKQSYRPLEVIFVDDQSKDDTYGKVLEWEKKLKDNKIDFLYKKPKEKLYCGNSYNLALDLASGDFCGVIDSDDGIIDGAVSMIVNRYISKPNCLYIWSNFYVCDENMKIIKNGFSSHPSFNRSLLLSEYYTRKRHCFSHWRTFRKNSSIPDDLFGKNLKSSVDKYMGYRLEECGIGHFFDSMLYLYRSGVEHGITANQPQRSQWGEIRKDAQRRRRINKLFSHGFS
jgi:glycosyltransferase involved in cell wall biosynthesis